MLDKSFAYCYISFLGLLDLIVKGYHKIFDDDNYSNRKSFLVELDGSLSRIKNLEDNYFTEEYLQSLVFINCDFNQNICVQKNTTLIDYKSNKVYLSIDEEENKIFDDLNTSIDQDTSNLINIYIYI